MKRLREYTIKEILMGICHRILGVEYDKYHYLRLNVDIQQVENKLSDFRLPVSRLTYEMVRTGDRKEFQKEKMAVYEKRFLDNDYYGYGIVEDGKLIYSTWFSIGKLGLPDVKVKYPLLSNEGLLEDSYCAPSARGRGIHGMMNWYRLKKLHEVGRNRIIAIVLDGNTPAMKVQQKCGFEDLGCFYIGKIFGVRFCTLKKEKYDGK